MKIEQSARAIIIFCVIGFGCASNRRELPEIDLLLLQNSQRLDRAQLLAKLEGTYLYDKRNSLDALDLWPVMVCGIPCEFSAAYLDAHSVLHLHDTAAAFDVYYITCDYKFVRAYCDSVAQVNSPYARKFSSQSAVQ